MLSTDDIFILIDGQGSLITLNLSINEGSKRRTFKYLSMGGGQDCHFKNNNDHTVTFFAVRCFRYTVDFPPPFKGIERFWSNLVFSFLFPIMVKIDNFEFCLNLSQLIPVLSRLSSLKKKSVNNNYLTKIIDKKGKRNSTDFIKIMISIEYDFTVRESFCLFKVGRIFVYKERRYLKDP